MLAHCFAICPSELGSQRSDAFVQFLNLWFAKNRSWWLVLESVHKGREQVDVLHFDWCQFVLIVGLELRWCCIR